MYGGCIPSPKRQAQVVDDGEPIARPLGRVALAVSGPVTERFGGMAWIDRLAAGDSILVSCSYFAPDGGRRLRMNVIRTCCRTRRAAAISLRQTKAALDRTAEQSAVSRHRHRWQQADTAGAQAA